MKRLVTGIIAHVDAGKTTLCESMLYVSGTIRKQGRVDHRDSFFDSFDQERQRGITIFSKQAPLEWGNVSMTLLDTPGHSDFSAEMERSLQIMDYAVLVISGTDGVQAHTETLWSLLERYSVPVFIFITKMDVSSFSKGELMENLKSHLGESCMDFSDQSSELQEEIAMLDEEILEKYMQNGNINDTDTADLIRQRRLFPCFFGSGLKAEGVEDFLNGFDRLTKEIKYPDAFGAKVYKIARDNRGKRLTYMKITGGRLNVKSMIRYLPLHGTDALEEKISEIRLYSGQKYDSSETVEAGRICAVLGLSRALPGNGFGIENDFADVCLESVLGYTVFSPDTDVRAMLPMFRQLEEEDPQLHVKWLEDSGEIQLQLMGAVQTDVLKSLVKERFDTDISFGPGRILYRETIADTVEGVGHYEPLKHYAEVHLLLEPGEPESGIVIDSTCCTDELDTNWQRLILTHLEEKQHLGVLTGSPITDMKITLVSGKAHLKHTEGGDFRQATYRAVRQGLMQAQSILLEPVYDFTLEVPTEHIGRAITDIHAMGGEHGSPEQIGSKSVIKGIVPAAGMSDYYNEVLSYTSGKGHLSTHSAGYRPCRNPDEIISSFAYDPRADLSNSPDSVFCAHGAGFNVKWSDVPNYMHLPSFFKKQSQSSTISEKSASESVSGTGRDIDEKELEAIMEREFGPIRRKKYSAATVNSAPEKTSVSQRKERLIVDGYNLIFAWPELKEIAGDSLETAREKLADSMINYCSFSGKEAVLVFDAYKVPGNTREKYDSSGLHIAYTKENESADLYIERLADEIGRNENVRVVTSDSLIRLTALRAGVLRTSSVEFISELKDALQLMREHTIHDKK